MRASQDRADADEMRQALRLNWQLWTIIQAELLDPQCPLENDIRGNVLSLAQYVDKHTANCLTHPKPGSLDPLISINRELAGGLFTTPEASRASEASEGGQPARPAEERSGAEGGNGQQPARLRIST